MLKSLTKAYQKLVFFGAYLKSPLLLFCRLFWGMLFLFAGWGKLQHPSDLTEMLIGYGFPAPSFFAHLVGLTEFVGGFCLLVGFASRLVAIPLIITMLFAYGIVHREALVHFLQRPALFVEAPPFNFLLTAFLVLAFGPGRFSVDYALEKLLFSHAEGIPKHQHLPKDED